MELIEWANRGGERVADWAHTHAWSLMFDFQFRSKCPINLRLSPDKHYWRNFAVAKAVCVCHFMRYAQSTQPLQLLNWLERKPITTDNVRNFLPFSTIWSKLSVLYFIFFVLFRLLGSLYLCIIFMVCVYACEIFIFAETDRELFISFWETYWYVYAIDFIAIIPTNKIDRGIFIELHSKCRWHLTECMMEI